MYFAAWRKQKTWEVQLANRNKSPAALLYSTMFKAWSELKGGTVEPSTKLNKEPNICDLSYATKQKWYGTLPQVHR